MKLDSETKSKFSRMMADATDEENSGKRADLLDRYLSEKYGDEVKGRSQFVASDVADAIEAILPDIMDVFTSSEDILEFSPVGPEDELGAKQETQTCSHVFWQENPGFENLYTWIKEALIQQNSYVAYGWVEKRRVTIEKYEDLTPEELVSVLSDLGEDYEIKESQGFTIETDDFVFDGQPINVKVRCVKKSKKFEIDPFPQEDAFITPRWSKVALDGVPLFARRHRDMSEEDLMALGFSKESIEALSNGNADEEEADARHHTQDLDESESNTELFEVYQVWALIDVDGDDISELVEIWCSQDGTSFLEKDGSEYEEVSGINVAALTPYIMPHRHIGRSTTEQVDDIQRVNTVLLRSLFDNMYATNYGRPYFDDNDAGEYTFEDLLNPSHGAPVRTGGAEIEWYTPPSVAGTVLPVLEKMDNMKEQRVGATRYNQGLDAESLNKTASGMKQIMNASQKKAKLIARTIAETGLRQLFLGIHRELRSGPVKEMAIRLSGQWVPVQPNTWKYRSDMTVNVGMGRGDRDEVRAGLSALGQIQRELMASPHPILSQMAGPEQVWNTVSKVAGTFGIHNLDPFLRNPASIQPPPPRPAPPDPLMMAAEADASKKAADAQRDASKVAADEKERQRQHEIKLREMDIREAEAASRIQTDEERLELDQHKAVMDDDLERDKLANSQPPLSYEQVTQN